MFRKAILPVILAVAFTGAFSSNASALTAKGKFAKKAHKIKGSWFLVEVEGHQVIAFDFMGFLSKLALGRKRRSIARKRACKCDYENDWKDGFSKHYVSSYNVFTPILA